MRANYSESTPQRRTQIADSHGRGEIRGNGSDSADSEESYTEGKTNKGNVVLYVLLFFAIVLSLAAIYMAWDTRKQIKDLKTANDKTNALLSGNADSVSDKQSAANTSTTIQPSTTV